MKNFTTLICLVFLLGAQVMAQNTISFQGKLLEAGTVVNGTRNFQFSIPDVSWIETHSNVQVIDGLYSVTLGNGDTPTLLPQLFNGVSERQLIISVDGNVLTPVTLSAPYQNRYFDGSITVDNGGITLKNGGLNIEDPSGDPANNGLSVGTGGGAFSGIWKIGIDGESNSYFGNNWNFLGGDQGINRGAIFLWGDVLSRTNNGGLDIFRAALAVNDDGFGGDVGYLALGGPQGGGSLNGGVKGFVELGAFATDGAGAFHGGKLMLRGTNNDDPLVNLEVQRDGAGVESGILTLKNSDGGEFSVGPSGINFPNGLDLSAQASDPSTEKEFVINGSMSGIGSQGIWAVGVQGQSTSTLGTNVGVLGLSTAPAGNESFQYGVLGLADGEGTAPRYGIRGEVSGTGSTFAVAARGINSVDAIEDGGTWGAWFDTRGTGALNSRNVGVLGSANKDQGINIGVQGRADGGTENWAGWFDGNVQINGEAMQMGRNQDPGGSDPTGWSGFLNLQGTNSPNFELGAHQYQNNDRPFMRMMGSIQSSFTNDNGTPADPLDDFEDFYFKDLVSLDIEDDGMGGEQGVLRLKRTDGTEFRIDPNGVGGGGSQTNLVVNDPDGGSVFDVNYVGTDDGAGNQVAPYAGQTFYWGNGTPNIQMGAPIWEGGDGAGRGFFQLFGNTPDGGGWYRGFANLSVGKDNGVEFGALGLEGPTSPNFQFSAHSYDNVNNGADRPFMQMQGSIQQQAQDEFGNPIPDQFFHPGLVNLSVESDGTKEWGDLALSTSDGSSAINLTTQNSSAHFGTTNNRAVQFGPDAGPNAGTGSNLPFFFMFGDDGGNSPVDFRVEDAGAGDFGRMILNGPNGGNIFMTGQDGSASFTGNIRAGINIAVKQGSNQGNNSIEMGDSGDAGFLNVNDANNNNRISLYGNSSSITLTSEDGMESFTIDHTGIGLGSDPAFNSVNINGPNQLSNASLTSGGTGNNFGHFSLHNDVGNPKAELRVNDDGAGSNFATLDLSNNWDNAAIHLNASSGSIRFTDSGGSEVWLNNLTLNGLGTNDITKDFVNATTHVEVGNFFGSGNTDGAYIGAMGDMDGNNISARGTLSSANGTVQMSDRRLKKDIAELDGALNNTLQMRGVSYKWKDENKSQRNQIGVIAQEVEEIYPEFVHTDDAGMKAVNYSQMVAVLIESIKELNAKITALENENTSLKASLKTAEANSESIEVLNKQLNTLQQLINTLVKQPEQNDEVKITEQK